MSTTLTGFLRWSAFGLGLLSASQVLAINLVADPAELAVGETVVLRITGKPLIAVVSSWSASGSLELLESDTDGAKAKGMKAGDGQVRVKVNGKTYKATVNVRAAAIRPGISQGVGQSSGQGSRGGQLSNADMQRIGDLLKRYQAELGGIRDLFARRADESAKPMMGELTERRLQQVSESFLRDLSGMGLGLSDLQAFKDGYKIAGGGGHPLFPGQGAWDDAFLATERALMMGRATLVQRLWMETLQDTFRANPDAAVFGEIDIGSWVKMQLGGLGFEADIDFSSVSIDPELNRWIVEQFQAKLNARTGQDMVRADALLTAHGQATPDVFIGAWGKTFAELDMLKRSKWKVIRVEKNPDGSLALDANGQPRIRMVEKPGSQLFWEVALRKLEAGQYKDVPPEVDYPKMTLDKEPMLSLEMLRHGIHDIEHGPYSRGQKLIKMLKYAERSYFMSKKAVAGTGFNPYAENDPGLARFAEQIIANKGDPDKVAKLLEALAGEEITEANVDAVTNRLVDRAKIAMHDNAARALAFRLNAVARIDNEAARQSALDKMWHDLEQEIRTFQDTSGRPPEIMVRALELTKAVMEGKLPPAELEARAQELHKLLNESCKLSDSVIDRIMMSDSYLKLKGYLRKLGWVDQAIDKFVEQSKRKHPNGAKVYDAVQQLNEQLNKTTAGSGLMKAADWADNAFSVYEAYLDSKDSSEALWNASLAMGRIGLQEKFPSLQIPLAVYDSFKSGSPKPLGMAVVFLYFPFAGQTYMISQQLQRADVAMRDAEFYAAMNKVLAITDFDAQGRITGFRLLNVGGKEVDSASIPPGNRKAIVELFTRHDSTFFTSSNFRYWASLVPKQGDQFGRYEDKLSKLRRFFALSEDVRYATTMLENFKAKTDQTPGDRYTADRQAALQQMEDGLTETLWIAMADMLESAARSVQSPELEARISKVEADLNLGDDDLGKGKGLLARIRFEIRQNSSFWSGENPYAVGLLFDKYLKAYERVVSLRNQVILELWHGLGVDYVAAQTRPMKNLLLGSSFAAPRLSGDPIADVALAEQTLAAHQRRGEQLRSDLAAALKRPVDADKDKDHLKALGQFAFEWEHLLDDCGERSASQCAPDIQAALTSRSRAYKDYLAKLTTAGQAVQLEIDGPAEIKLGDSATYTARFIKAEDRARANLKLRWTLEGAAAGDTARFTLKADKARVHNLGLNAVIKEAKGDKKLGETTRSITVTDPSKKGGDKDLLTRIDTALKSRDWKRLAEWLDSEKKSPLKLQDVVAWQANIDALNKALDTLKDERMRWALGSEEYLQALDNIDGKVWDQITRQVANQREKVEMRCVEKDTSNDYPKAVGERCAEEGRRFEANCLGTWPDQHWMEKKRLRIARQSVPDEVHTLHSAGYFSHRAWFEAVEQLTEKYKLPFPWPKPVTPLMKYASSCANVDLPGAKKLQDGLSAFKVVIEAPGATLPFGQAVTLNATASGGKPPYQWTWSTGASGSRASVTPKWAGEWTVNVSATDAEGNTGHGQATLRVAAQQVRMGGVQAQVFYGSQAWLTTPGSAPPPPPADPCVGRSYTSHNPFDECATVKVDAVKAVSVAPQWDDGNRPAAVFNPNVEAAPGTATAGKQRVVWKADTDVSFAPPTSTDGRSQVTYTRMGKVRLWCEIQQEIDGVFHTTGECTQETVTVIAPKFSVSFSPAEGQGRVGEEVRATIRSQPAVQEALINYFWFDPPTANRLELTRNAAEIAFKLKDAKPLLLKVLARVPYYGDDIADIAASYTGLLLQLKAWVVEPGTRPMTWDAKKGGLVPVARGAYTTHEQAALRVEVEGGAPSGVRWNWTVNDGTTISNPISQTPTVSRTSPGEIQARIEARNTDGVVLGSAEVGLSVVEVRNPPAASAGKQTAPETSSEPGIPRVKSLAAVAWKPVQTTAGMYSAEEGKTAAGGNTLKIARKANNPGGLQHAGRGIPLDKPISGDFEAQVGFENARIDGGLNQIELQASFADGTMFYVVRDREGQGSHVWAPGLQGNATCGNQGVLSLRRVNGKVSGYCDHREIWSGERKAPLTRLQFVLQNNGSNDPISVTFHDWQLTEGLQEQPDVSGRWQSSEGQLTLKQNGSDVAGNYSKDGGEIVGTMTGNVLAGYWIENASSVRCAQPRNGRYHWGKIRWAFVDNKFAGVWSYCEQALPTTGANWSGERIGAAPVTTGATPSGSPTAPALGINRFTWHGMDEDRVGDMGNGKPNGTKDGHFRVELSATGRFTLSSISLWSANDKGDKAGGQIWHSRTGSNWMLGIFNAGTQLNASHVASLGVFPERVSLDLYANSSGWFNPGQWFVLEVETADGKVARQTLKLAAPTPTEGQATPAGLRLKLLDDIPSASSDTFRKNLRSDLSMHTSSWDKTPYAMAPAHEFALNLKRVDRACLAGDAQGGSGWRIDNFLLLELFDQGGRPISAGVIGAHEGVSQAGRRLAELASGHDYPACAVDLKSFLPLGRPFHLKVTAMDYGGIGYASNVWLLLDGQVSESTAGSNLARGQPASQSSSSQWSKANDAQGAVDGVINGGSGFHTSNEANPWWQVDLGGAARLTEVRIYNRQDCCAERARTLQVLLSDNGRDWRNVYRHDGSIFGGKNGQPLVVPLAGNHARYVRLQLAEAIWLHLDEVEVMGTLDGSPEPIGRDYTSLPASPDSGIAPAASTPAAPSNSAPSEVEQLKDAVKQLKGLFKW